ncbi:MAG: DUF4367 domain-containing protein [Eubacterium sp.]|nr:DUF4367 domain-containing protein [Eubacterium sp.]
MKKHQEEMLFRTAANSYVEQEDAEIRKEMEEVEDVFKKMAEENTADFEKILEREFKKKNSNQPSKKPTKVPVFYKVAVVLLVFTIGVGVSVVTVPALRNRVVDFVNYVTGRYAEVGGSRKDEVKRDTEKNKFDAENNKKYVIGYIPKGYICSEKIETIQKTVWYYIDPQDEEAYILFSQYARNVSSNIDFERSDANSIIRGDKEFSIIEKENSLIISLEINGCELLLESNRLDKNELLKMVDSITE